MNNYLRPCLCAAALCLLTLAAVPAISDTMSTQCEVYKGGNLKKKASGDCDFSQHQGVVVLKLANGDVRTLTPTGKANEYRSKAGDKVTREMDGGDQVYKWKDRTIRVSMGGGNSGGNKHAAGQPVPELQDLVGQRGGNATDKLINRGYEMKNNANSGKFNYSNWRKKGSGQCITLRTEDGLFLSIVYSTDLDCKGH